MSKELGRDIELIAQYLSDVRENKSTIKLDLVASAVRDLYYKGRLNTIVLPMTDSDKLRLEMLLYHYETDLLQKGLIRRNIEREYRYTAKAFDRTYQDFRNGLTPGVDPDELLRLEIKALMAETDAIKKARKKRDIATRFGMSYGLIDQMIASIRQETQQNKVERLSLHDFFNQDLQEADWLVPGLLPRGEMALLTAMPKVGKTLLAIDLAFCLATGKDLFLGEPVKQGKILLIITNQSERSTYDNLGKRGFDREELRGKVRVMTNWNISQLSELEKVLEDFRPNLTIIDCLKSITVGIGIPENSPRFGSVVTRLRETLARHGSAGLLLHHSNKNKRGSGLDRVRGSITIVDAAWGAWQLGYVEESQKNKTDSFNLRELERTLTISASDSQSQIMHLRLDPGDNSFVRVLTESDKEKCFQSNQVLDLLKGYPNGLDGKVIANLTGIKSIYLILNRLCEREQVESFPSTEDRRAMAYRLKKLD